MRYIVHCQACDKDIAKGLPREQALDLLGEHAQACDKLNPNGALYVELIEEHITHVVSDWTEMKRTTPRKEPHDHDDL